MAQARVASDRRGEAGHASRQDDAGTPAGQSESVQLPALPGLALEAAPLDAGAFGAGSFEALIGHLRAAALAPAPVIFEIHLGGHGFSLTVIGNQVYQLEAFASAVGGPDEDPRVRAQGLDLRMSLLNSIGLQRSYTLAAATTALAQMTADTRDQRQYGAAAMGWNAGPCGFVTAQGVKDPMAVWWKSASLLDNAQIAVATARRVQRQAAAIRQILGVPDDGGE